MRLSKAQREVNSIARLIQHPVEPMTPELAERLCARFQHAARRLCSAGSRKRFRAWAETLPAVAA